MQTTFSAWEFACARCQPEATGAGLSCIRPCNGQSVQKHDVDGTFHIGFELRNDVDGTFYTVFEVRNEVDGAFHTVFEVRNDLDGTFHIVFEVRNDVDGAFHIVFEDNPGVERASHDVFEGNRFDEFPHATLRLGVSFCIRHSGAAPWGFCG